MALCVSVMTANAQITTGESSSKVIRTGNRAKAGNFGIYLGATSDIFKNLGDNGPEHFEALPLINLKYMKSDALEYRLGFEWWKKSDSQKYDGGQKDYETNNSETSFMFYPGIAYHFSNKNLLDVYVGGEVPFGFGSKSFENDDYDASAGHFRFGLGAFIGLQAYIGNLPLALGLEYGVSTQYNKVSDGSMTQDKMTIGEIHEDLSESKWRLGQQLRLTLSYYFNL